MSAITPACLVRLCQRKVAPAFSLAFCFLVCPAAYAQNSGGGWVAYQVPDPPPYVPGAAIDWTGLTVSSTTVKNDGTTDFYTGTYYVSYFSIGDNVGANTNQSIAYLITGPSTYKWNWTPTGSDVGAPAPSLYVLARASGGACLRPNNDGHTNGLSGSATFNFASSVPAFTYGLLDILTQYKVMPASGGAAASVGVNPTLTANVSGASEGDEGYSSLFTSTAAFPIVLAGPDPMGRPDLGDGSNQRVYGAEQPDGQLTVPASVYVPGASTDGTTFLLPHVALSVSPVMQTGAQPFTFTASGPNMLVNTTSARPGYTSSWPSGQFCYIGLPPNNSYFGNHLMTMSVDGTASQTANYQLFFSGTGSNWPNSDGTTPNWYEYYNQVYSSTEFYGTYDPNIKNPMAGYCTGAAVFSPGSPDSYDVTNLGTYLGASAIANPVIPVFALRKRSNNLQYTTLIGELHVAGIHSYLRTYFEEIAHRETFVNHECLPPDRSAYNPAVLDTDNDSVPDSLERKFGLDPQNPDTTGYYKHYANVGLSGDNEVLAAIIALKYLLQNKNLWQQDWADGGGLQYGARPPYNCAASRNIFPWFYHSIENPNLPDSPDIPADALTDLPNLSN